MFFINFLKKQPPGRLIAMGFAFVILTGAVVLVLPVSVWPDAEVSFVDALFTSTSAVCVTGLIAIDVADHFTPFGQAVVAVLIQIGGLGVTSVGVGLILAAVTVLSLLLERIGFTDANIIMMYILGTVLTSVITSHWSYSLVSSAAGVFIFNYLFTTPRFSLTAYGTGYPVTFVVMFLTAFITGSLALRYKEQALQSARIAHRTKILFDTNQILAKAENREEIFAASAVQIGKLTGCDVVMFDGSGGKLSPPHFFNAPEDSGMQYD